MSESLKNKTAKGMLWSILDGLSGAGVTFLVGLVLARLLTPTEYGIMAIIAIFIAVSNSIVDSGFSNALIRKTDIKRIDYNTVFFFNLGVSAVLYLLLFSTAPFIADFFHEPLLVGITRVIGWVLIINGLAIIPRTIFVREVDFKSQTKASVISSITSGAIGIGMAWGGYGVWSLVGQQLSRQLLFTTFLWVFSKWRPVWEFSKQSFKEMFSFGSKLLLSGLLNTIYNNIYYFVIGKCYSPAELGQYTRSEQFKTVFSDNFTAVIQRVSFPVLSSIQNEPERLLSGYRKVIKSSMLISFAAMLGMAAVAKPMILLLIGEKWLPAVYYLQILCLAGMLYPLHAINLNILQVKGRSDLFLRLEIYKKILGVTPILVGVFWGIAAMLWTSVLYSCIAYWMNSYYSAELLSYPTLRQIKDIIPTFLVSLAVAAVMWSITLLPVSSVLQLILQIPTGIVLAVLIYERLRLEEYLEIKEMGLKIIRKR